MRAPFLSLVLLATVLTGTASAGYLGLGIGTSPDEGGADAAMMQGNGRSGRLIVGKSLGQLSVEGTGTRYGMFLNGFDYHSTSLAAALKYTLPLGNQFEAFARGGVQRTWLTDDDGANHPTTLGAVGNGYLLGAGIEYRLKLGVTAASLFLDYQHTATTFTYGDQMFEFDATARMWTMGVTLAL